MRAILEVRKPEYNLLENAEIDRYLTWVAPSSADDVVEKVIIIPSNLVFLRSESAHGFVSSICAISGLDFTPTAAVPPII